MDALNATTDRFNTFETRVIGILESGQRVDARALDAAESAAKRISALEIELVTLQEVVRGTDSDVQRARSDTSALLDDVNAGKARITELMAQRDRLNGVFAVSVAAAVAGMTALLLDLLGK